jgi:hypothetical protein
VVIGAMAFVHNTQIKGGPDAQTATRRTARARPVSSPHV